MRSIVPSCNVCFKTKRLNPFAAGRDICFDIYTSGSSREAVSDMKEGFFYAICIGISTCGTLLTAAALDSETRTSVRSEKLKPSHWAVLKFAEGLQRTFPDHRLAWSGPAFRCAGRFSRQDMSVTFCRRRQNVRLAAGRKRIGGTQQILRCVCPTIPILTYTYRRKTKKPPRNWRICANFWKACSMTPSSGTSTFASAVSWSSRGQDCTGQMSIWTGREQWRSVSGRGKC